MSVDLDRLWAVIPVAGAGTRLRPHTHTRPKPLLPVAGQPILGHILDQLLAVGIRRIVLVTGHMGEQIVEYVRSYEVSGEEVGCSGGVAGGGSPLSLSPSLPLSPGTGGVGLEVVPVHRRCQGMAEHDNSYKRLFSHVEMVADLLKGFVHEAWIGELDFTTLEKASGSFRQR